MLVFAAVRLTAQDFKFWMSNPTLTADGQTVTYLHIYQTDANNKQYWNFQVEITLPEGIHIAKKRSGREYVNDATLNEDRFDGLPHVLGVNMPDATTFKALCGNSASKQPYYNDDIDGNIVEDGAAVKADTSHTTKFTYKWTKYNANGVATNWNGTSSPVHTSKLPYVTVSNADVSVRATFTCEVSTK